MNEKLPRFLVIAVISILFYFIPLPIPFQAHIVLSLLVFAALLWVTETIPLYLTSILISLLIVLLGVLPLNDAAARFADPVIILFFAGFMIARAMQKHGLDRRFAWSIASKTTSSWIMLLLVMVATAFMSMWMSNTATTAIMIPIGLAIVLKAGKRMSNFTKAMVLGIAYAANIGGMGTIIGSPPNAITVANLGSMSGTSVSFLGWMARAIPLVIVLIPIAWITLLWIYPPERKRIKHIEHRFNPLETGQKAFLGIFALTILLWLTTELHGVSSSMVGIIGVVLLFISGLLKAQDLGKIRWDILILFGGGLVLGTAMFETGLSAYFADMLAVFLIGNPTILIIFVLAVFSIIMGAMASNTATAAIIIPVILPLASSLGLPPETIAIVCGLAVSLDFLLPVGTPPNAIAYSTGKIKVWEMLKAGIILTILSALVLTLFATYLW
jgi:sodium-dependent dicarboxylate transporter 2/3/5